MPLRITDKRTAPTHFPWAECIISIDDPGSEMRVVDPRHGLFLFDDLCRGVDGGSSIEICESILKHACACGVSLESRLLVHCVLGISRSTAVALGIEASLGLDPETAWHRVHQARPSALPNLYVVQCFDELLGLRGDLFQLAESIDREQSQGARRIPW